MHSGGEHVTFTDMAINFVSGSLGGIAGVYVGQPLDTVKVKMQTFPHLYNSMFSCLKETFLKDGVWRGLYAGTIPAVVANVAENSVLFASYGAIQSIAADLVGVDSTVDLHPVVNALCGSASAFFCSLTLCPTELIKCKLQAIRETGATQSVGGKNVPWTPYSLTAHILKTEGIRGMYRGLPPTVAREMLGYFFFFGVYEGVREAVRKEGQTKEEIGMAKTILAGGLAGQALWTTIFPFDVAKSRMQIQASNAKMTHILADIYRKEGVRALFNGLEPTLVRTFPATGVLFVVYEYSKKFLHSVFG
jgi:solute carrier family 25 ornithine transporter 2/15